MLVNVLPIQMNNFLKGVKNQTGKRKKKNRNNIISPP